jgi:2-C-methyl-D-erythritol 4-phosphate cytidylyltransferase
MGSSALPKQYSQLAGRSVLEWSLAPLLAREDCAGMVVVLAAGDERWPTLTVAADTRVRAVTGGGERADSVLSGLRALQGQASADDWVLVHDAARPCLQPADLTALIDRVRTDEVGGLLAAPLVDTLKRADDAARITQTVNRAGLWRALTPQMFRYAVLLSALTEAAQRGVAVTDDSQAVELLGLRPLLVAGSVDNIKITVAEDLQRAERILAMREHS